jgi:hypothetical protein
MKAKVPGDTALPPSTTKLGDWYGNALVIERQQVILAASSVTLLPVVLPAAPFKTLPVRLTEGVADVLQALGVSEASITAEKDAMADCVVAATSNRQVLGSMNDFKNMLDFYLEQTTTLLEAAVELAHSPCSPIGMESPRRATLALFGEAVRDPARPALRLVKG